MIKYNYTSYSAPFWSIMSKVIAYSFIFFLVLSFKPALAQNKFLSLHHLLEFVDKAKEAGYSNEELNKINLKNRYNTVIISNFNELKKIITEEIGYNEDLLRSISFEQRDEIVDAVKYIRLKVIRELLDQENALENKIFSGEDLLFGLTQLEQKKLGGKRMKIGNYF